MKTTSLILLLLLSLWAAFPSGALPAQRSAPACRLETQYDREADLTTITCDLHEPVVASKKLIVQPSLSFRGKRPNETTKFWLGLMAYQGAASRHTRLAFRDANRLLLRMDAARLEVPVTGYRNEFYELNRLLAEQGRAEIARADLQKLLDATHISGQWGSADFSLPDAALVSLKDFITRQALAAPAP
jgi:hypothetical protein